LRHLVRLFDGGTAEAAAEAEAEVFEEPAKQKKKKNRKEKQEEEEEEEKERPGALAVPPSKSLTKWRNRSHGDAGTGSSAVTGACLLTIIDPK